MKPGRFDGLNSSILRPLTFNNKYLRIAFQQGIRRFPVNMRPMAGIPGNYSSKGMGFLARGYIRLHQATGHQEYADKAKFCLDWLIKNRLNGYSGACWGNHFDYQSRVFYLPEGVPTIVWVALIGHAFLDAYEHFKKKKYLETAESSCEHILQDLERYKVTVHGLQLSVHGWKNQRILKFIAKMLIRFRSSLSPYSQQSPGIRAKNRFLV